MRFLSHAFLPRFAAVVLAAAGATTLRAQANVDSPTAARSWNLAHLVDEIPAFFVDRLPILAPDGAVQLSLRPHLGDFFHEDYVRVPVNVRWRASSRLEFSEQFDSYYSYASTHAGDGGLSGTTVGAKWEPLLDEVGRAGLVLGLDYRTPFNHAPRGFTDGYRHLQPYVATTQLLDAEKHVYGYASLGANFLERTVLPSNFGRNQLHANSLAIAVGVARQWSAFRASLTARLASTALTSDEGRQNFQLRPEVAFPLRRNPEARTQIVLTLGGRVMWGPDGRQVNTNGGVRINYRLDRGHTARPADEDPMRFSL